MITWRTELLFECDCCQTQLMLDQIDAPTKRGMFRVAKKLGWLRNGDNCTCPECAKRQQGDPETKTT